MERYWAGARLVVRGCWLGDHPTNCPGTTVKEQPNMLAAEKDYRCKAKTKSGKDYRAYATAGSLCFLHSNPDKASELGRIGGRSNRRVAGETDNPLLTLDGPIGVAEAAGRLVQDVCAGRIQPRIATIMVPLLNLVMRAIEATDLE